MRLVHFTCALGLILGVATAAQEAPATLKPTGYTVFIRGTPLGREEVTIQEDASGTTIVAQGRLVAPFNAVTRRAEVKYSPQGAPERFVLDGSSNGADVSVRTIFTDGTARTEGNQGTTKIDTSHKVSTQAFVLPNGVFSLYTALARRLATASPGTELHGYILPVGEIAIHLVASRTERIQVGTSFLDVRRHELVFEDPGGKTPVSVTTTDSGALVRMSIPSQALDVVREDVASPTARTQVFSNAGDEAVVIPASGFNLGATITTPRKGDAPAAAKAPQTRMPAVILLSGSGTGDRDGFVPGFPTLAQLAASLADAGVLSVRYDKRGHGQSGGRSESATLLDYAEDARSVVRWLQQRKDIDPRRIAVVGHSEGAWVALMAGARERRIAAVASIAGAATTGAQLMLEQQQQALGQMTLTPEEREQKIALQKQIQTAVITGKGWEGISRDERRAADTPWFHSVLTFDPATVIKDVRQPLLFVHGDLDRQIPVSHADRLADLARKTSDSKSVEVVIVKGVNHLLVPATTGDVSEYISLATRDLSKDATAAITSWLTKTFAAIK
jgi:pimeloyl-ACP methyl ester carboxylesterase